VEFTSLKSAQHETKSITVTAPSSPGIFAFLSLSEHFPY